MEAVRDYCLNAGSYALGPMREKVQSLPAAVSQVELSSQAVKSLIYKLQETFKFRYLACELTLRRAIALMNAIFQ